MVTNNMRSEVYLILLIALFATSAAAQKANPKSAALPASIAKWSGQDADKLLTDPAIKARLKALLGKAAYASFMDSFETQTPITKDGDTLFASGCLIHACTHLESALAIDIKANTVHAAIYNEEKPTRYFNEGRSKTPPAIADWAARLIDLNSHKD
jgi:hypothetical protein